MKFLEKLAQLFKEEVPAPVIEQKPVELKKRTMKLVEKKETVDLGVTSVLLKFQDGRELITRVYGSFRQYADLGQDENQRGGYKSNLREPEASVESLDSSVKVAENFIRYIENPNITNVNGGDISGIGISSSNFSASVGPDKTYVDCPRKPTVSFVGKVISAQIIKTEQCLEEVTKYSVEPV